jgi:dTDP-4-amino-4,6-dideoxygalactose transaminase
MIGQAARTVPFLNLKAQFAEERDALMPLVEAVFARGDYVGGEAVTSLERELAEYCGVKYVVALSSGTDALILGLKALGIGPGDEVITPSNSFVASTAAIVHVGATPVFADVLPDQSIDPTAVEAAITTRTRAIMPVHLTGRVADMTTIGEIAQKCGLAIIEDAAQSIGSRYDGKVSGSTGTIGAFSTHPLKNLNAAGDGGFVTTNDPAVAERVAKLRNHGFLDRDTALEFGFVSRMDSLQAVVLGFRLKRLSSVIERRRQNALRYFALLDQTKLFVPPETAHEFNTYHLLVIQADQRDELQRHLGERGISTKIHYPVPIHLQPAAEYLGYKRGSLPVTERQANRILSIPINQYLRDEDVAYVAETINGFFR